MAGCLPIAIHVNGKGSVTKTGKHFGSFAGHDALQGAAPFRIPAKGLIAGHQLDAEAVFVGPSVQKLLQQYGGYRRGDGEIDLDKA